MKKTLSRLCFPGAALALALCAAAPPAAAQTTTAKPAPTGSAGARQLFGSGEAKFKAGDYAGALNDFQAADAIKAAPQAARYIGLCQDKLGHYPEAVAAYERFLADVPSKMTTEGDQVRAREAEIKAMPGHVHIDTSPTGATVTVDGKPQPGPAPFDVDLPPGTHALHATLQGRDPGDQTVTIVFASKQDVTLQLPEAAPAPVVAVVPVTPPPVAPPPPPPAPAEPHSKVPALITGGLAIVAAGVGTAFGIITINDKSTFNKDHSEATAETGQNHALVADMCFGVAITLGVTSVVLLLTKDEADANKGGTKASAPGTFRLSSSEGGATLTAAPLVSSHGGGAGALLRF